MAEPERLMPLGLLIPEPFFVHVENCDMYIEISCKDLVTCIAGSVQQISNDELVVSTLIFCRHLW